MVAVAGFVHMGGVGVSKDVPAVGAPDSTLESLELPHLSYGLEAVVFHAP